MAEVTGHKPATGSKLHHYVPQFLLSRWKRRSDERIHVFRRRRDGVLFSAWCLPREAGAQNHLWSLNSSEFGNRDAIEQEFFSPLDAQAAAVLAKIEEWGPAFNDEDREVWQSFVVSLLVRSPAAVQFLQSEAPRWLRESAAQLDEGRYDPEKQPLLKSLHDQAQKLMPGENSATRLNQYISSVIPEYVNDRIKLQTVELVCNEENLMRVRNMRWIVRKITQSENSLLIGDMPMTRIFSFSDPRCALAFPLSPNLAFIASQDPTMLAYFTYISDRTLVKHLNINAAGLARSFVVGDCKEEFLNRWFLPLAYGNGKR